MPRRDQLKPLDAPTLVRRAEVPYVVWGDDESGFVNDLFYVLSRELVVVTVTMPPGARFRSSDKFRAYFDTHECLYVLKGEYTCQDPETGEVRTARTGEMLFMPEKRWHYGYNFGSEDLHLLECISPPTNQSALAHVPRPKSLVGWDPQAPKNWPRRKEGLVENLRVCRRSDAFNAIIGDRDPVRAEVLASTERVFFAVLTVNANSKSALVTAPADIVYHADSALVHVQSPSTGDYFAAEPGDVVFIPAGVEHRIFNHGGRPLNVLMGAACSFGRLEVAA